MEGAVNKTLEKDALVTLMYSDVFDMPLTAFEVWKYRIDSGRLTSTIEKSGNRVAFASIVETLLVLAQKEIIVRKFGMFALKGREYLIPERIFRMKRSDVKWKKFLQTIRWMRFAPFIRMIAVTGRLATKQIGTKSDWDVLVVMEHGHIWMGRLFFSLFLGLLGKRRRDHQIKDRVCLNHFLTTNSLEIALKDLFAAREYAYILPVFGEEVFLEFEKQNMWILKYLPNWEMSESFPIRLQQDTLGTMRIRQFLEKILSVTFMERQARNFQKRKIENNPKTKLFGAYIVANDNALIFLPKPQGPRVFEKFMERVGRKK